MGAQEVAPNSSLNPSPQELDGLLLLIVAAREN